MSFLEAIEVVIAFSAHSELRDCMRIVIAAYHPMQSSDNSRKLWNSENLKIDLITRVLRIAISGSWSQVLVQIHVRNEK